MLIRVNGASSGIKEYLENGRKDGRDFSRDELDERVILSGDLELTDAIINSMDNEGDRYLHVTLSFKEDEISPETLSAIVGEFKEFAMTAYDQDEYNFYAEAHLPKIKSYVHQQSGELIERKPHIHVVIPEKNLLSGQHMNPFGKSEHQTKFIDAFQEHINAKYGLASPKDHRRIEYTSESAIISRYKGDLFEGTHRELKDRILGQMLERGIDRFEDFQKLAAEHGQTRTRNEKTEREYVNVKQPGASRGVNLKEYVFSRQFVELPTAEKRAALAAEIKRQYDAPGDPRKTDRQSAARLAEWRELRAKELKYVNSGNRGFYQQYRAADRDTRRAILADRETRFYAKHRKEAADERTNDPTRLAADIAANLRAAGRNIESASRADRDPEQARRKLADRRAARAVGTLVQRHIGDQRTPAAEGRRQGTERHAAGRRTDSVVGQLAAELSERRSQARAGQGGEFSEIKQQLDARRLLAHVSKTHGVMPEKYEVTKGKDGADRIRCGTRNLNVSDFLTKEMNLPWKEAAPIMREVYAAQRGQEPIRARTPPRAELWSEYRATWPAKEAARREQAWENQRTNEAERRAAIKAEYDKKRREIEGDRTKKGKDKKAEKSVARMAKVQAEQVLRAEIKRERDELRTGLKRPYAEQYRDFLTEKAQEGNEAALAELRRQRREPERQDESKPRIRSKEAQPIEAAPIVREALRYTVARNGDVTYHDRQGRALIQDTSQEVRMLQTDAKTIETGLRLAVQKYGQSLDLKGDEAFKRRAVEVAVAAGMRVEFTDQALNQYKAELMERQRLGREFMEKQREAEKAPTKGQPAQAKTAEQERAAEQAQPKHNATQAKDSGRYSGVVIDQDEKHVYQRVGHKVIQHQKDRLDEVPDIGEDKRITYAKGRGIVENRGREIDR